MLDNNSYTVGWICAIKPEFVAALAFLDEEHDPPESVSQRDNNSYALGSIGKHNVVIAMLPDGQYGKASAATVARDMLSSFPNVRIGLMVGIGGGAPSAKNDIRLGDVVVSAPSGDHSGVFQYDFGKTIQNQVFQVTGVQDQPPQLLRTAISNLRAQYTKKGHTLAEAVDAALGTIRQRKRFAKPAVDRLFHPQTVHPVDATDCSTNCDASQIIIREPRDEESLDPTIHYGLIASADTLMKDALVRDKLAAEKNVLCFEMEAAGLMNHFPCLVIRGICDYSDSHKSKEWQGYAALIAAAFAKDLLRFILPTKVEMEMRIVNALGQMDEKIDDIVLSVTETSSAMKQIKADKHTAAMKKWLRPPNYATNLEQARKLHHPGTGTWLLRHSAYQELRTGQRRALWLQGLAGCGKTVLSSTIFDHLIGSRIQPQDYVVLSFFFDFSDVNKQTLEGMLRSLLWQLYQKASVSTSDLKAALEAHQNGAEQPSEQVLEDLTWKLLKDHDSPYIVLDALDEATTRTAIVSWIERAASLSEPVKVRLICTSRPEEEFLRKIPRAIGLQNCLAVDRQAIDIDIESFVTAHLQEQPEFVEKRLSEDLQKHIRNKIGRGADGMFRWASCQLKTLADCKSILSVESALECLPRNLDETYRRMMNSIPPDYRRQAIRILHFLLHCHRPLQLNEAIEVIATDAEDGSTGAFNVKGRLFIEAQVIDYCPGLVTIVGTTRGTLHLSHFSVKEYLLKDTIFQLLAASISITRTCLTYLSTVLSVFSPIRCDADSVYHDFPFMDFATEYLVQFARFSEENPKTLDLILDFLSNATLLERWRHFWNLEEPDECGRTALFIASQGGLYLTVKRLFTDPVSFGWDYRRSLYAAAKHGYYDILTFLLRNGIDAFEHGGDALLAASYNGDLQAVQVLLDSIGRTKSAQQFGLVITLYLEGDIALGDGLPYHGSALLGAIDRGHYQIVEELLNTGADVNAQGDTGTALQIAANAGRADVVRLLIEKGAYVDAQTESSLKSLYVYEYATALHSAARRGRADIVEILLNSNADVEAEDKVSYRALHRACESGSYEAVKLLLDHGADVNASSETSSSGLQIASRKGYSDIVQLLRQYGAVEDGSYELTSAALPAENHEDTTASEYGDTTTPETKVKQMRELLVTACRAGRYDALAMILGHSASGRIFEANVFPDDCALVVALERHHKDIAKLLLSKGAAKQKVKQVRRWHHTSLLIPIPILNYFSSGGFVDGVTMLLDNGADVNEADNHQKTALHEAAAQGHVKVVSLLLRYGANVNRADNYQTTALHEAAGRGHVKVVSLLLRYGASVNVQSSSVVHWGRYERKTPLYSACEYGSLQVVKLLLENGAQIKVSRDGHADILQRVVVAWKVAENEAYDIVTLLLEKGAGIDSHSAWSDSALCMASAKNKCRLVELFLQHGAAVNHHGRGDYGTALHAAMETGNTKIAKILLEHGADVNAWSEKHGSLVHAAAIGGSIDWIHLLLEEGVDVNRLGGKYDTALQAASAMGHLNIVKLLLEHSPNPNTRVGGLYGSALAAASDEDHLDIVELLLKRGVDLQIQQNVLVKAVDDPINNGRMIGILLKSIKASGGDTSCYDSALSTAVAKGRIDSVQMLLDAGADPTGGNNVISALHEAVEHKRLFIVDALLSNCKDVNELDARLGTVLQAASRKGLSYVVGKLLMHGADINHGNDEFESALQAASRMGHPGIVKMLLAYGADVESNGGEYGTAIYTASLGGHYVVVHRLIDHGVDVNARGGPEHLNALHAAASRGHRPIVRLLLAHGADIMAADDDGWTALHLAAKEGHLGAARVLLDSGADTMATTGCGRTPLILAIQFGRTGIVQLLLASGVDVKVPDSEGRSSLHWAADLGRTTIARLLLDKGSDIKAIDHER